MIAAAPVVDMLAVARTASAAQDSGASAQSLVDAINGDVPSRRQDAADQLVARSDSAAQVHQILRNPDNQPGQIAAARALAKLAQPDPAFITDLQSLLGTNAEMTEPAAQALAAISFDDHPEVFATLKSYINNPGNPETGRAIVIRSLGQIVQKTVADYLIQVLNYQGQSPAIANASTTALADLTGISSFGRNGQRWTQWWIGIRNASPAEFRSSVLNTRDLQFKIFKQHDAQLVQSAKAHLQQDYLDLLNLDKGAAQQMLLGLLNDRVAEIRDKGVDLVYSNALTNNSVYTGVRGKLLSLINDPDQNVRLDVVKVLLYVNDHDAGKLLIARLKLEQALQIRVEIVNALGKLQDPQAVPALLDLLHDSQPELVIAAANAIANLGDNLRKSDPAIAGKAADQLHRIVDPPNAPAARDDVRAACLTALAALHDKLSLGLFLRLVQPAESSQVRQAALLGLGSLGDTNANQQVINQLDDNDRAVRAAAAVALQTTATPEQADEIFRKMKSDPDPKVSDALWVAMQNLYTQERPADLDHWASELSYDPDKRLLTLQKLGDAYAAEKDLENLAQNQQAIADVLMQVKPPRPLDAIRNLQEALKFKRGPGKEDPDKLEAIVGTLLDDELEASQWSDATAFAAEQIKIDPVYQTIVGPRIKNKADELSTRNPDAANSLIDAAMKMDPPLDPKYSGQLQQIRDEMKNKPQQPPG